ncbi:MAG: methyltransferase domain-containing protein [Gemmataceae bacterium]
MITRLRREQEFHDHQALERASFFDRRPEQLAFADDDYLAHETWIRPAFDALGDVAGRTVLDCGCGHGMASVVLARRGARVIGCDLSSGYLTEARRRGEANGVRVAWLKADAERLPFADGAFDRIWGNAILHHLDMDMAGAELRRLLKPGGRAVFCEPWGENPLLRLARARLPYPGKERTVDEQPLRGADLAVLRRYFPSLEWTGYQLLGMAGRLLRTPSVTRRLERVDRGLLRRFPSLQRFCRYVVLVLERSPSA